MAEPHVSLIVRQSQLEDTDAILRIKQDPKVVALQYRTDPREYLEMLQRVLYGNNKTGIFTIQFSTIELDSESVGYICHHHYSIEGIKMVIGSWNLASAFWGRGIMKVALTQLLNEWVNRAEIQHVFADHFRKNSRCKRLLDRLGFSSQEIPLMERLSTACRMRCLQWVVRRRMDASVWRHISPFSINNPMG